MHRLIHSALTECDLLRSVNFWHTMYILTSYIMGIEIYIWRRMTKTSWVDKISNKEMLAQVKQMRMMLSSIWARKQRWIGHVLWHDELLCNLMEVRKVETPTRGRRRLQNVSTAL